MDSSNKSLLNVVPSLLKGAGQVMFQGSAWTGLLFLIGIFWGSYECHAPLVAWGAVVGVAASTLAGYLVGLPDADGEDGLWGFNGILVGCAFPTFLGSTWQMWVALVICAMATTWVRTGFNNVMAPWKVNSLTFPFVFLTWLFLLSARVLPGLDVVSLSVPALTEPAATSADLSFGSLVIYWLKGVSQVFLVNSWVTGVFFLVGLAVCSVWAAAWAAIGSAIALAVSIAFHCDPATYSAGLMGFSPVLTGIALGCTFYKPNLRSAIWCIMGIIVTVFIQAGMDALVLPYGIPTLTGPFCIATWLFLLPCFKMDPIEKPDHSQWHGKTQTTK